MLLLAIPYNNLDSRVDGDGAASLATTMDLNFDEATRVSSLLYIITRSIFFDGNYFDYRKSFLRSSRRSRRRLVSSPLYTPSRPCVGTSTSLISHLVSLTDNRLLYYHFLLVEYASLSINPPCTTRTRPVLWYRKDASPAPPPPVSPGVKRLAFRTVSSASSTPPYTSFARLKVSGKPTRVVHHKRV